MFGKSTILTINSSYLKLTTALLGIILLL